MISIKVLCVWHTSNPYTTKTISHTDKLQISKQMVQAYIPLLILFINESLH
jgi:hypothetical protein